MKRKNLIGNLLTDFRNKRELALQEARHKLWKRNKLANPKKRDGYEIREVSVHGDGRQRTHLQLWKKIDEVVVEVSANVQAGEIKSETEDVGEWLT